MSRFGRLCVVAVVAASSATLVAGQRQPPYRLPAEDAGVLPAGPGSALAAAHCAACHSLDYLVTQPRGKSAKFWHDSVAKMRSVYGADIPDEEAAAIAGYLARTYGDPAPVPIGHRIDRP